MTGTNLTGPSVGDDGGSGNAQFEVVWGTAAVASLNAALSGGSFGPVGAHATFGGGPANFLGPVGGFGITYEIPAPT